MQCSCDSVRLVGSNNTYEGRLEVFHNGNWGTVCSDLFTNISAKVACNLLGYGYVSYFHGLDAGSVTVLIRDYPWDIRPGSVDMTVIMGVASNRQEEAIASSWNLPNKKRPG